MKIGAFNIVDESHAIHGEDVPFVGWNCGPTRTGYRMWITESGKPFSRAVCARQRDINGWLYAGSETPSALRLSYELSNSGYLRAESWSIETDEDIGAVWDYTADPMFNITKSLIEGHGFLVPKRNNPNTPMQGFHETDWLNPTTLEVLDPQYPEGIYPPTYVNKVKFRPRWHPYCERFGVLQNAYILSGGDDGVLFRSDQEIIWHAPRIPKNLISRNDMLEQKNQRPYCPSAHGLPFMESARKWELIPEHTESIGGENVVIPAGYGWVREDYTDWTWTPKRNWQGGAAGWNNAAEPPKRIWHGNREYWKEYGLNTDFLYESGPIYWDVSTDAPEHFTGQAWAAMMANREELAGRAFDLFNGETFNTAFETPDKLFEYLPQGRTFDVRFEVLTYHWNLEQKNSWFEEHPTIPGAYYQETGDWVKVSENNYFNSKIWSQMRMIAPCVGIGQVV